MGLRWTVEFCGRHREWEVRNPKDDYLASFGTKREAVAYAERLVPVGGELAIGLRSKPANRGVEPLHKGHNQG